MKIVSIVCLLIAVYIMTVAKGAIHEIEACLFFMMSIIAAGSASVITTLKEVYNKSLEDKD